MICVSVGRGRHRMMMAEHKYLVENHTRLVELRLDYVRRSLSLSRLKKNQESFDSESECSTVIACRRVKDGGKWRGTEKARVMLLRSAVAEGFDYVDIEEDIADQIPRYGSSKRIISYHNFRETPEDLEEIRDRMLELDPDIIKIATMANRSTDNLRLLRLCRDAKVPTIAFCMGEIGMVSRLLCCKFGAPFTYAAFHAAKKLAPGQLSFREMEGKYRFHDINKDTSVLGVIADPVAHSLSPLVHNANLKKEGLNTIYLPFRVPREDLKQFLSDCSEFGIEGLSVTIPHKENVLKVISDADPEVTGIGASNTLVFKGEQVFGYNTDCQAAMASLAELENAADLEKPFGKKTAIVLGSGGASRAIVFGLLQGGAKVIVSSRNLEKATELAEDMKCETVPWDDRNDVRADYLINCTPVGMHPEVNESPIEQYAIRSGMVVFDTVYNPEQTLLVKHAREQECRVITGVEMFVRQAALQFKLFTGREPDIELMRNEMKNAISAARGKDAYQEPDLETPDEAAGGKPESERGDSPDSDVAEGEDLTEAKSDETLDQIIDEVVDDITQQQESESTARDADSDDDFDDDFDFGDESDDEDDSLESEKE